MSWLLDTNIVLYLLGGRLAEPLPPGRHLVSVITELELLSFAGLDQTAESQLRQFLDAVTVAELSPPVKTETIQIRRTGGLKLPDAIVAATAKVHGCELVTNDSRLLAGSGVPGRSLRLL